MMAELSEAGRVIVEFITEVQNKDKERNEDEQQWSVGDVRITSEYDTSAKHTCTSKHSVELQYCT